ncbi:hypothetical protein DA075_29195 [Methylobacterium currus]|uniref:Helicase C-terminal domain-containing protein n=1 Tax=Methylobacterium currus TaxID=2051553 RepID=A0A2R4WSB7_9HYPH|nr:hypothetical protein DA075_29195 [Methylobacterium currus]
MIRCALAQSVRRPSAIYRRQFAHPFQANGVDVIVQVRKLGEGFDHPLLAVAAVFRLFANLSPFVQFVGRIMRVVEQGAPEALVNRGVVVFHAGANTASRWADFQAYTEANRDYFDQLLPVEGLDFGRGDEIKIEPAARDFLDQVDVRAQGGIDLQEIPLIRDNPEALDLLRPLHAQGYSTEQISVTSAELEAVPTTRARERQAMRQSLDMRIRTEMGRILSARGLRHDGRDLDRRRLGRTNFVILKGALDR